MLYIAVRPNLSLSPQITTTVSRPTYPTCWLGKFMGRRQMPNYSILTSVTILLFTTMGY